MPDLKDTYLNLLQQGYKPQDVEKFVKEMQTKPSDQVKSPTPKTPGIKPITTTTPKMSSSEEKDEKQKKTSTVGSLSKAMSYLAGDADMGADNFHPGAEEVEIPASKNKEAKKDCKKDEKLEDKGFPTKGKCKKGSFSASVKYLANEDMSEEYPADSE